MGITFDDRSQIHTVSFERVPRERVWELMGYLIRRTYLIINMII